MKKLRGIIRNNWNYIKIAFQASPLHVLYVLLDGIIDPIILFFEHTYMLVFVIDCIQYQRPFAQVVGYIAMIFVLVSIRLFISALHSAYVMPTATEKINRTMKLRMFDKATGLDMAHYDNPEFYNQLVWAVGDAPERVHKVLDTTGQFFRAITGIIMLGGFIFTVNAVSFLFIFASFFLTVFFSSKRNKAQFTLDTEVIPKKRKCEYFNRLFYLNEYAKEIRMSDIKPKLYREFHNANEDVKEVYRQRTKPIARLFFVLDFLCNTLIFDGVYILYLLFITIVQNAISYGSMVSLYNSAGRVKYNIRRLSELLAEFAQHSLYIEKIRTFLDQTSSLSVSNARKPMPNAAADIEFRNVSFSYTEDSPKILKNINLTIKAGEKIALVGYNGAGKTTLVKLIMRLYDPTEGEIYYNGVNIKEYDLEAYRHYFGVIFQDYQIFAATVAENIVMEDTPIDKQRAQNVFSQCEFSERFSALDKGFAANVTKEFDDNGVELSGGESQKLAISRALYKDSDIVILDEPSSALDPLSEYTLNESMRNLSDEKTVVFISHRLSTTRMADQIFMLEHGCIIEQGNHEALMEENGKYAEMFLMQAQKYRG